MLGELSPGRGWVALQGPASPTPSHALARDSPQSPENSALSSDFIVSGAAVRGGRPCGFSEASCPERARPPDLTCFRRAEGRGGRRWVRGGSARHLACGRSHQHLGARGQEEPRGPDMRPRRQAGSLGLAGGPCVSRMCISVSPRSCVLLLLTSPAASERRGLRAASRDGRC